MSSYQPLGRSSPSLQPSIAGEDIEPESLRLREYNGSYEPFRTRSTSQPPSPPSGVNTKYDSHSYSKSADDIETYGLIKDGHATEYRLYKRRWLGLAHLTLLTFTVGWGYSAPGAVAQWAINWYGVSWTTFNNMSITLSLVYLAPAPVTIWFLNKYGAKWGIATACAITVLANWIIYAGARSKNFNVDFAGNIIGVFAYPMAQGVSTQYARQWFGDRGRTFAVACSALAYPLGSGFGGLIGPSMLKPMGTLEYDQQALIIAIVFTAVSLPAPFLPNRPPTPPSAVAAEGVRRSMTVWQSLKSLSTNPTFWLQFVAFAIFVGAIECVTSIINQALVPYHFAPKDAGYALASLIFAGVAAAIIISPILDRTGKHIIVMKIFAVIIAIIYTVFPWVPGTNNPALLYVTFAAIGIFSITLEPTILEYQASTTHPVPPEYTGVLCWCGTKITTAVFVAVAAEDLIMRKPEDGQPKGSLFNGLIFIAAMGWLSAICVNLTEVWIFKRPAASKVEGTI